MRRTIEQRRAVVEAFAAGVIDGVRRFKADPALAKEVLAHDGTLKGENRISNALEATVDQRSVWVRVEEVDPKVTRVLVQCRTKGGGADLALASEIDKRIALRLASTR